MHQCTYIQACNHISSKSEDFNLVLTVFLMKKWWSDVRTHQICFLNNRHLSATGCCLSLPSQETIGAMNLVDFQQIGIYDVMSVLV